MTAKKVEHKLNSKSVAESNRTLAKSSKTGEKSRKTPS